MMKGYYEADSDSIGWAGLGAAAGIAVGNKAAPKVNKGITAAAGALFGLAVRAFVDPKVSSQRAK